MTKAKKKNIEKCEKDLSTIPVEGPNAISQWNLSPKNNFSGPFIPFPISSLEELAEWEYKNSTDAEIINE